MPEPMQPSERHAWHGVRRRGTGERSEAKQARLRKIAIIAGVMLVLAGAVAALLFYLREAPRPALAVLRIDQYRDPLIPASPWAAQDRNALRQLGMPADNTFTSQEKELLKQALQNIGRDRPRDQPLVIYLCAYAAVQDDGGVAILPADARLDAQATWLPVKEVLKLLQDCPVKRRLLLLDLAIPCVVPKAGLLAANVPERLQAVLKTAVEDDPNLQILASCMPGQVSLASAELGHTVFAHYVIQGLAGRADGFPNGTPNTRVTVRELVDYVTMQVDRWAYHNTGLRQKPEFFGNATIDYELTVTDGKTAPELTPLPAEYPGFLADGWAERDRWWNDPRTRTPPKLLTDLEEALSRADDRWRKGDDATAVQSDLRSALARIEVEREKVVEPPDRSQPRSLAEALARGQKKPEEPDQDARRYLRELGDEWAHVKQPKPNEKPSDAALERLTKKMQDFAKKFDGKPFDFAWTIFTVALKDGDLRWEHLRCWCELLRPEGKSLPPYAEIDYLQRLAKIEVAKPEDWPSAAASDALHVADLAEQVEALKPSREEWLRAEYAEAKKSRQEAEALLFAPAVAERLQAGAPMKKARANYDTLLQHLKMMRDARRTRDEAFVFLEGYTAYTPLEETQASVDDWLYAVQTARELDELLKSVPTAEQLPNKLSQVSQKAEALRTSMNKLRGPVEAALSLGTIGERRPPRAADAMEMRALLRLPGLSATERQTIWANARDVAGKLNAEAVRRETVTDTLQPADDARAVRQESDRARQRAAIMQGLLRLKGSPDVEKVEQARNRVDNAGQEAAAWEALRKALRQAWKDQEAATNRP